MKNLLIYINPAKDFVDSKDRTNIKELAKIQIDNSLDLGWAVEDIVFVTNFPYEYGGVKALVIDDDSLFCDISGTAYGKASKINVILYLLKKLT